MRTGHVARDWLLVKRSCLRRSSGGGQVGCPELRWRGDTLTDDELRAAGHCTSNDADEVAALEEASLGYVKNFRELNLEIRRIFVHWVEVGIRRLQKMQGLADPQLEPHTTAEAPGAEGSAPPTGPDAIAPHLPVPMYESGDNGHYE
jgi:hypothetical protein